MSMRVVLAACAMGLLAGCTLYTGDPDPPSSPPVTPPPDASLPPPDAPSPPPDAPSLPPPTGVDNLSRDGYDAANHRLLVSDCANSTIVALDLATGERSVLIDTWPWSEPGNAPCVRELVVDRSGRQVFATVSRWFDDTDGATCHVSDLVAIDLASQAVTPLENIEYSCCDDYCGARYFSAPQIDDYRARLLYLETDSVADYSTYYLTSTPLAAGQIAQQYMLSPGCFPDDYDCTGEPWHEIESIAFDPAAPNERILQVARHYSIGEYSAGQYLIDTRDIATGATVASLPVELLDGNPSAGRVMDMSVDIETQRALITWGSSQRWLVVAVDLVTGEETLLYDGSPTADGAQLTCPPEPAFDSRDRRLLLVERNPFNSECTKVFAVDADTGTFTQIATIN